MPARPGAMPDPATEHAEDHRRAFTGFAQQPIPNRISAEFQIDASVAVPPPPGSESSVGVLTGCPAAPAPGCITLDAGPPIPNGPSRCRSGDEAAAAPRQGAPRRGVRRPPHRCFSKPILAGSALIGSLDGWCFAWLTIFGSSGKSHRSCPAVRGSRTRRHPTKQHRGGRSVNTARRCLIQVDKFRSPCPRCTTVELQGTFGLTGALRAMNMPPTQS